MCFWHVVCKPAHMLSYLYMVLRLSCSVYQRPASQSHGLPLRDPRTEPTLSQGMSVILPQPQPQPHSECGSPYHSPPSTEPLLLLGSSNPTFYPFPSSRLPFSVGQWFLPDVSEPPWLARLPPVTRVLPPAGTALGSRRGSVSVCAHAMVAATKGFFGISGCEHSVAWVFPLHGDSENGRNLENQFGTVDYRFLGAEVQVWQLFGLRYSSSSICNLKLHTVTWTPPQLSHAHPHTTSYCSFIGQNVCLCLCTHTHTMPTSLPARFLSLGSQFHQSL